MLNTDNIKQVVEYVQVTGEVIEGYQQKVASLEEQLAATPKEASAVVPEPEQVQLDSEKVSQTVDKMAKAGFLKKAEREQAQTQISEDPAVLLTYLDKLSQRELDSVPSMGKTALMSSDVGDSDIRESDRVFEQTFSALARKM